LAQSKAEFGSKMSPDEKTSHSAPPSKFFTEHISDLRDAARAGPVVDLACGRGRHMIAGARAGLPMVGLDRNPTSLAELRSLAQTQQLRLEVVRADLEAAATAPLKAGSCGAIVVFRYLHRPLASALCEWLAPGGLLLYETFSTDQIALGWGPRNPEFLLRTGELARLFAELEIIEQWEGTTSGARPESVGRLLARRARNGSRA
jgi:tellurite methyltransferase